MAESEAGAGRSKAPALALRAAAAKPRVAYLPVEIERIAGWAALAQPRCHRLVGLVPAAKREHAVHRPDLRDFRQGADPLIYTLPHRFWLCQENGTPGILTFAAGTFHKGHQIVRAFVRLAPRFPPRQMTPNTPSVTARPGRTPSTSRRDRTEPSASRTNASGSTAISTRYTRGLKRVAAERAAREECTY